MGLFDRLINNAVSSASREIGSAVGQAAGSAIQAYAKEATASMTTEMRQANQNKRIAMEKQAQSAKHEMEDAERVQHLPALCPHCKAPTEKKLVCEYCGCKVIED